MARILTLIYRLEDGLLALILTGMIILASGQILLRNFLDVGFAWADPLTRVLVLWVGMLGALAASREDKHIAIDVLSRFLPPRLSVGAKVVTSLFTAIISGIVAYHAGRFVALEREAQVIAFAGIPIWILESVIPVAFGLIALRYTVLFVSRSQAAFSRKVTE